MDQHSSSRITVALCLVAFLLSQTLEAQSTKNAAGWSHYGGDAGGMRFSTATEISRGTVQRLHRVWEFHTHALDVERPGSREASFETTPILSRGVLYLTSPFDVVFALDAKSGTKVWTFDPKVRAGSDGGIVTSRGVSLWQASQSGGPCSRRLLVGTLDARLIELDADTGSLCEGFGKGGEVDLTQGMGFHHGGAYQETSAPAVAGDVVIVGSGIGDNRRVDAESGVVRGFDVRSGQQLWAWEPLPWASQRMPRTGAGNAWSTISVDAELGLAYVPTGSASPDYYGGLRPGDNRDADSIVALDVKTGRKVWAFQVVHHDLWDYDIAAQPLLFKFHDGTPAVAVATKTGQVFVFDRRNGKSLFPIQERSVPQTDVPGETTSATQPFSSLPAVGPLTIDQNREGDDSACRSAMAKLRYEGTYTPPSERGSILFPGNLGGVNWGSMAFDPASGMLYANNNRAAYSARLVRRHGWYALWLTEIEPTLRDWPLWIYSALGILALNVFYRRLRNRSDGGGPRHWLPSFRAIVWAMLVAAIAAPMCFLSAPMYLAHFGHELSPQTSSPYYILRDPLLGKDGRPCGAPPSGAMTAINLNTGTLAWEVPLGSTANGARTGTLNFGGPIVTAGGLVFSAATADPYLRAVDAATGNEVWKGDLPAPAQSTPMTYEVDGKQYVVVAAGGHASRPDQRGDSVVAFALSDR